MKETGLMFKAPLVRAILSGQKTQTRRLVKPQPITVNPHECRLPALHRDGDCVWHDKDGGTTISCKPHGPDGWAAENSPFGKPGDRIYVRETFVQGYKEDRDTGMLITCDEEGNEIRKTTWYRATDPGLTWSDDGESEVNTPWKPAIHMPKDLARIWLEVTGLRVERLQSISRGDAMAEGCPFPNMAEGADPREWFAKVWKSTGGDWAANPWVWVIDFKRIEKPR